MTAFLSLTSAGRPGPPAAAGPSRLRVDNGDGRIDRTRERILSAARSEFAESGYFNTTVGAIARAADVSVGSVYLHFGSKRALALWYVYDALGVLAGELAGIGQVLDQGDVLAAANEAFLRQVLDDPVAYRLWVVALTDPVNEPGCEEVWEAIGERARAAAAQLAEDGGLLDGGAVSADLVVTHLLASWTGIASMLVRVDGFAVEPAVALRALEISVDLLSGHIGLAAGA